MKGSNMRVLKMVHYKEGNIDCAIFLDDKEIFAENCFCYSFSDMMIAIQSTLDVLNIDYDQITEYEDRYIYKSDI
jgi:hypothetical protein